MLDFATLRAANVSRDAEWNIGTERLSLTFRSTELAGETGEACNVIKKIERERLGIRGSRASIQDAREELSDVIICVDLLAIELGIDLGEAVREKFNLTSAKYGLSVTLA